MFQDKLTREIAAAAAQIKTEPPKNEVNAKSVEGAVVSVMTNEELKGNQHKIDANKNGKIDSHDFKLLRAGKKPNMKKEEVEQIDELSKDTLTSYKKKAGSQARDAKGELDHLKHSPDGGDRAIARDSGKTYVKRTMGVAQADRKINYGKYTREEVEQLDEIGDTSTGRKALSSYVQKALHDKDRQKGLRKATSRLYKDNYYGKKTNEETENVEEGWKGAAAGGAIGAHVAGPIGAAVGGALGHATGEVLHSLKKRTGAAVSAFKQKPRQEQVENVDEAFPTVADARKRMASKESNFEKKKISTGTVYSRKYKAEPEENEEMPKKKAKTMKEMLNIYSTGGAEALVENLMIEEPSQEEYKTEVETAQAKADGKIRNDKGVAKASSQGVKVEEVEIEVLDADEINGIQIDNIEERSMTDAEMNKREEIVKSMKKNMQGFKDRYGDKAKDVMYATATKQSMKEETESEHYKAGHQYASDHAQDSGFKVTARARKKEMLSDNPHPKGSQEHKDWHRGALDGHQVGLDNM